jgi:hypothetical protein
VRWHALPWQGGLTALRGSRPTCFVGTVPDVDDSDASVIWDKDLRFAGLWIHGSIGALRALGSAEDDLGSWSDFTGDKSV